jgi:hypothetical protein
MRTPLLTCALLALAGPVAAQTLVPVTYELRYYTGGTAPSITYTFEKTAMTCDLAVGPGPAGSLRITDPERPTRDCQWIDPGTGPIRSSPVGVAYTVTLAGRANATDGWGPESAPPVPFRRPAVPGVPGSLRLVP